MKDCEKCLYNERDCTDEPCFKCLSGVTKRYFVKKEAKKNDGPRKKRKIEFKDENTQLPWT